MKTLAQEIFEVTPNITAENELLAAGFDKLKDQRGSKAARYYFWYHEDFPSDFVSEYFWMQRQTKVKNEVI